MTQPIRSALSFLEEMVTWLMVREKPFIIGPVLDTFVFHCVCASVSFLISPFFKKQHETQGPTPSKCKN